MAAPGWTTVAELEAKLRTRWRRGNYLRAHARGEPFSPISLPVGSPKADDLVGQLDESLRWLQRFHAANRTGTKGERFVLEHRIRRARVLGDNPVPVRARVDTFDQLCAILGTDAEVAQLDRVLDTTARLAPDLVDWVSDHPIEAIDHGPVWDRILTTVAWIIEHDLSTVDLRHLDTPGVDTKFVERHRRILRPLLDQRLPPELIDPTSTTFAGRYGFRPRPTYVRFRLLAPVPQFPAAISELELRVDELARVPLPVTTVFIVENQASYLAFPSVPEAMVIFGGGYGVTVLEGVPWLTLRELVYWGDIDTHGFAIVSRLRRRVPTVRTILMDRETLLAHHDHLGTEPKPSEAELDALTVDEEALYRDLIEDRYGASIRLEQERVRFSALERALRPWLDTL